MGKIIDLERQYRLHLLKKHYFKQNKTLNFAWTYNKKISQKN